MRKLVFIGFAFQHHKGTHAGYNHIMEHVSYDHIIDVQRFHNACCKQTSNLFERIARYVNRKLWGCPVIPTYLLKCVWLGWLHNDLVFHFVYGENTYYDFSRLIRPGNRIVCTLHQPVVWFENRKWKKRLQSLDKIILLSEVEVSLFRELTGKDNVVFIPHGISTGFYHPDESIQKEKVLLTVGNWLRDYSFADEVYQRVLKEDPGYRIVIVSSRDNMSLITPSDRILFLNGISDEELRLWYQKSSVLFLPLKRYTANNSLLEAAACGCNIVIASNSLDNSYIPNSYISLCRLEIAAALRAIKGTDVGTYNSDLASYVKQHYSWDVIGQRIYELLTSI